MASSSVAIPPYQEDVPLLQKRDMIAARQRATFNPSSMTSILFSAEATAKRRRAADLVLNEKLLTDAIAEWPFLGRTERMQRLMPIIVGWT
jgi:phage gp16-like protein